MSEKITKYTSANVDVDFYNELLTASERYDIRDNIIFKDLINLTKQHVKSDHVIGLLTEYQNHKPEQWEKLHYGLNEDEIENFSKMRQKYKISISKLAFIGFILFWELLMRIYEERLKPNIPQDFLYSYQKIKEKFQNLAPKFILRLKIVQKE